MRRSQETVPFLLHLSFIVSLQIICCLGNLPPTCQYDQFNSQTKPVGQVRCACRQRAPSYNLANPSSPTHSFPLSPSYSGNLNFLKEPLSQAGDLNTKLEVVIKDCHQIQLYLNFRMLHNYNINLRILDSNKTEIVGVTLRELNNEGESEKQSIVFKNIRQLLKIGGRVEGHQGSVLELKAENVGDIEMDGLESAVPLKLTAKHLSSISIGNSQIHELPWPGFYFFNVSRVLITGNNINSVFPRSVHITNVGHLNISNNIFPNFSQALNVDTVKTKITKCNRETMSSAVDPGCSVLPPVRLQPMTPSIPRPMSPTIPRVLVTRVTGDPGPVAAHTNVSWLHHVAGQGNVSRLHHVAGEGNVSRLHHVAGQGNVSRLQPTLEDKEEGETIGVLHTILGVSDVYGLVLMFVSSVLVVVFLAMLVLVVVFLAIYWCCSSRRTNYAQHDVDKELAAVPPVPGNPFLDPHLGSDEDDEYSNSSKSHLAQGGDSIVDPLRSPFITVSSVRTEKGKGGVLKGSLTLGPSFTVKESNMRSVANNQLKHQTFSKV